MWEKYVTTPPVAKVAHSLLSVFCCPKIQLCNLQLRRGKTHTHTHDESPQIMTKRTEPAYFQFHNKVAIPSQIAVGNQWMMFCASSFNSFIISQRALGSPHHRKLIPLSVSLSSRALALHIKCSTVAILTSLATEMALLLSWQQTLSLEESFNAGYCLESAVQEFTVSGFQCVC